MPNLAVSPAIQLKNQRLLPLPPSEAIDKMATTTMTVEASQPQSPSVVLEDESPLTASFNYWGSTEQPQESEILDLISGKATHSRAVECPVMDIRPLGLSSFNLEKHGFQVLRHASKLVPPQSETVPDMKDPTVGIHQYWPEVMAMLKSQLGVRCAIGAGMVVRDKTENKPSDYDPTKPRTMVGKSLQPFFMVHGDWTEKGTRSHLRALKPDFFEDTHSVQATTEEERNEFFRLREEIMAAEDEAIKAEGVSDLWDWSGKGYNGPRWAYFSIWRALETVQRDPLAVLDAKSLFRPEVEKPYVAFQRLYPDRPGFEANFRSENPMIVAPERGDQHQWYYISHQTPEEVYALKIFDSDAGKGGSEVTPWVGHSAFRLPAQEDKEPRRSVEVRMLAIW
jgi:hypothetical protein